MFSRGSVNEYLVSEAVSDAVVRTDTWSDWWSSGKRNPASPSANVKQTETPETVELRRQLDISHHLRIAFEQERNNYNNLLTKYNADLATERTEITNLRKTIRINQQHLEQNKTDFADVQKLAYEYLEKIHSLEETLESLQGYA